MGRSTRLSGAVVAGAALVAVLAVLAGCTSDTHGPSRSLAGGGGTSTGADTAGGAAAVPEPAVGAPDMSAKAVDAAAVTAPGPSVIRTADLTVASPAVAARADRARAIVTDVGGTVDGDDRQSGPHPSATLTLRVPPAGLAEVLTRLSALGTEQTRHMSTRDVTTQVADVDSRVRSALAAINQLRALYARATRVSDVIAIESELAQRESDLESLQAQQRALAGQVAMATVTLYLVSMPSPARHHATHRGFLGGLDGGWRAFTHGVRLVVTGIGATVPFAALLAAAGLTWLGIRRRRRTVSPEPLS